MIATTIERTMSTNTIYFPELYAHLAEGPALIRDPDYLPESPAEEAAVEAGRCFVLALAAGGYDLREPKMADAIQSALDALSNLEFEEPPRPAHASPN